MSTNGHYYALRRCASRVFQPGNDQEKVYNSGGPKGAGGGDCRFGSTGAARSTLRQTGPGRSIIKARCLYSSA